MEILEAVVNFLTNFLGFSPALLVPVWVMTTIFSRITNVRNRFPTWKNTILAAICFIVSFMVVMMPVLFSSGVDLSESFEKAFKLAGMSALLYQFFKPFVRALSIRFAIMVKEKTGLELEKEDNDLFYH